MEKIEVKILEHNLNGMARFLARLTQRGHLINSMEDIDTLYRECVATFPSGNLIASPHTTLVRMNYITVAIAGLSTKAVSQLRTHATRLTFMSTSTQYSSYGERTDNYVLPDVGEENKARMQGAYDKVHAVYRELLADGVDADKAGYLLPQGLRKALIISGNLDAWRYVLNLRLCHRNTVEVQHIMHLIYDEMRKQCGEEFVTGVGPNCLYGNCKEGNKCCGNKFTEEELR